MESTDKYLFEEVLDRAVLYECKTYDEKMKVYAIKSMVEIDKLQDGKKFITYDEFKSALSAMISRGGYER